MKEFLEKLNLSENAIKVYLRVIGQSPYTYYELKTILPKLEDENFNNIIEELMIHKLLIQIESEKPEVLTYYYAIPPINPILNYYSNIESSFSNIKNAIQDLIVKSVNDIFQKENKVELDSVYNKFTEIKKDFEEDSLLQKKDAEDIAKEMNNIQEIEEKVTDLQKRIQNLTQTEFANLIKIIGELRKKLIDQIKELELKKREERVISTVEEIFKSEVDKMVGDFTNRVSELIQQEFEKLPLESVINRTIQQRNDFKMLLLNLISSFEMKMKRLSEAIKDKKEKLEPNIENLKNIILSKLNTIINNSVDQIANLNQPIIKALSNYEDFALKPDDLEVKDIWKIETLTQMNEEIINAVNNSKIELVIIIPNLKDYLTFEIFQEVPKDLKIKLASSDPHVNSKVMKFKSIENLEFRNYENNTFIGIKSDENLLCMGFINNESKNPLKNFNGLGINNPKLINIFKRSLYNVWSAAEPDYGGTGRKIEPSRAMPKTVPKPKTNQIKKPEIKQEKTQISKSIPESTKATEKIEVTTKKDDKLSEKVGKELQASIEQKKKEKAPQEVEQEPQETTQKQEFTSNITPEPGDAVGMEINTSFNTLLQNLNNLTGEEFADELEDIADLILEKRGFSVTLHDLRRTINDYKNQRTPLKGEEKNNIFESIETWKQKLL